MSPEELLFADIPVVVSATRTERSIGDVPSAVTVITAEEVRASGATSLDQLLMTVPGLDFMRISRADLNVKSRGFVGPNSSSLLVMIDGRSVYLDFFGITLWEHLNVTLQDIERIEVVRGPGSSLYGANAFLGTINIVTKRPKDLPELYVRTGVGPETGLVTSTASRTVGDFAVKGSAEYRSVDDFRNKTNPAANADRDRHDTGLLSRRFNGTVEYTPSNDTLLRLSGGVSRGKGNTYTSVGTFDSEGPVSYAKLDLHHGDWKFQTFYTRVSLDLEVSPTLGALDPAPPPGAPDVLSTVLDFELQRTVEWQDHDLLAGFNVRRLVTDSDEILGSREQETHYAAFFQDEVSLSRDLKGFLGLRLDEHPKTGFQVSPRVGFVYHLSETARVRASFSRSFQNPTHIFNYSSYLISPAVLIQGDDDLDPVWVTAYELGLQLQPHRRLQARMDLFYNVLEDFQVLTLVSLGLPSVVSFSNQGRTKAWGGELALDWRWTDAFRAFASYSFQEAHGPLELATPRHKASGGVRGSVGPVLRYALTGHYFGHTKFEPDPITAASLGDLSLPSRFTVDAYMGVRLTESLEVGLHGRNLFHQVRRHHPQGDEIGSELLVTFTGEF
jgi:iron complex outermembrane receptor protein